VDILKIFAAPWRTRDRFRIKKGSIQVKLCYEFTENIICFTTAKGLNQVGYISVIYEQLRYQIYLKNNTINFIQIQSVYLKTRGICEGEFILHGKED